MSQETGSLNGEYTITDGKISGNGLTNDEIPLEGKKPTAGTLTYVNNKLQSGCLVIDGFEVRYSNDKFSSQGKGDCGTTEEPPLSPEVPDAPLNYAVSFNTNEGSSIDSEIIISGNKATQPSNPTKSGYVFGGWYSNPELTNSFNFNTSITQDTTIYAKWTEAYYTITFNTNGGSSIASKSIRSGRAMERVYELSDLQTKSGYYFGGWYQNSGLTSKYEYTSRTSDITLYAKWISLPSIGSTIHFTVEDIELTTTYGTTWGDFIGSSGSRNIGNGYAIRQSRGFVTNEAIRDVVVDIPGMGSGGVGSYTVGTDYFQESAKNELILPYDYFGWMIFAD